MLIVSGDHVYRMDYGPLLAFHARHGADLTVACTQVPCAQATRMGVLEIDGEARVRAFTEKPASPVPLPRDSSQALVNMGVYVFKVEALVRAVIADAKQASEHDFGHNVIPAMVRDRRVYAFDIAEHCPPAQRYWRDVGTLDSYFEANLELLLPEPPLDLFEGAWPVRMHSCQHPPALMRNVGDLEARVVNSVVSSGCVVSGGSVLRSVLSPRVFVSAGAVVAESILMPGVRAGERALVHRAIVDENVVIPADARIGCNHADDRRQFLVTEGGVVVVPEGALLGPSGAP